MPRLKPLWERALILEKQIHALRVDARNQGEEALADICKRLERELEHVNFVQHPGRLAAVSAGEAE